MAFINENLNYYKTFFKAKKKKNALGTEHAVPKLQFTNAAQLFQTLCPFKDFVV